jgi:serine phosphatase RsbU (regulator of sigma subunit)
VDEYDVDQVLQEALDRLTLLADAGSALASTLDLDQAVRRVGRIIARRLADWCCLDLVRERAQVDRVGVIHRDPHVDTTGLEGLLPPIPKNSPRPLARALRGAGPLLLDSEHMFPSAQPDADPLTRRQLELYRRLGADSVIVAPLRARRQVLGAVTVTRTDARQPLTEADLPLVEDLAHRVAMAVDNARLHDATQRIAERLQLSLLPDLPEVAGLELSARYRPAHTTARVGGDWYDSFVTPSGELALIIGDVIGHDLGAAVIMSQLRNMLRAVACDHDEPSGRILERLDVIHDHLDPGAGTASCLYGLVKGGPEGPWTLDYSSAGHLPPLLTTHDGDTTYLEEGQGLLLGVEPDLPRPSATHVLPAGSTLLLYTDGLVEHHGEDIDEGLTRLRQHAAALARESLDVVCDELLAGLEPEGSDDIALLALQLPHEGARSSAHAPRSR